MRMVSLGREALQEGEYAHAFWLCVQCGRAMGTLSTLRCAAGLAATVDALYEEAAERLDTALQAACADFRAEAFCKVGDISAPSAGPRTPQICCHLSAVFAALEHFVAHLSILPAWQSHICTVSSVQRPV